MLSRLRKAAGALSFGLVAAVIAALLAHVAIDAIGDVALARDAYDGLSHDSRGLVSLALLLGTIALALRLVLAALSGAAGRAQLSKSLCLPSSRLAFVAAVVFGAVALLVGMESLDALVGNGRLDDIADALGGSPVLGLGVVVPLAGLLGWVAWRAFGWLAASHDALLRAIGSVFAVELLPLRPRSQRLLPVYARVIQTAPILRRAAKRGPPARFSA